jgi:hypothetical protein
MTNLFFFFLFLLFGFTKSKLDRVNVLLPFKFSNSETNPYITLNSDSSCMDWKSLDERLIKVTPKYDNLGCSKSAEVEVIVEGENRISTSIIARSFNNEQFKCDVFIDKIQSISIVTTTRQLNFEIPYEVKLSGLDIKNNTFSSLEGIKVQWEVDVTHLDKVIESSFLIVKVNKIGVTWIEASLGNGVGDKVYLSIENPSLLIDSKNSLAYPKNSLSNIVYQFQLCPIRISTEDQIPCCVQEIKDPSLNDYIISSL